MTEVSATTTRDETKTAWHLRRVALGGSALSRALQADPTLHGWLAPRPQSLTEWNARVRETQAQRAGRDWYTPIASAFAVTGRAAERLVRAAENGVVVTTGQQPGLFGGPAYTFSKAMSALAMADALESSSGVPVAPVFWAATDDADWLEAAVTELATPEGLLQLTMNGPATDGIAMSDVVLGPMDALLRALRENCGSVAHDSILALVEHAYVPHATVGAAYVQLLRALLEPLGIAVLDAAHPALRATADPIVRSALQHAGAVHDALTARTKQIEDAGYAPQVDVVPDLSLVFRTQVSATGRERVRARVPIADAARVLREADIGSLGSNVVLRPVIERALLPTVAYHAGPGEYAYFAQVAPIAGALSLDVPLAVPRWSGEVLETRAERVRDRLELTDTSLRDPHAAETLAARRAMEPALSDALDRLRVAVDTQLRALRNVVKDSDGVLADSVVDGLTSDLGARLDRFERRVTSSVKRRETALMRDVAYLRAALRPGGDSPERRLNLLPMLVRFGTDILDAMRNDARTYVDDLVNGG